MDWLLKAAMESRTADLLEAKGANLPDDSGKRFRNPRSPPVESRFGNVFHSKTRGLKLVQLEIEWRDHAA